MALPANAVSMAGRIDLVYLGAFRLAEAERWEWIGGILLWLAPIAVRVVRRGRLRE